MKKLYIFLLVLLYGVASEAQPTYYNHAATTGGTTNVFPFNANPGPGKRVQFVIAAGEFNQPTPATAGNITTLWFWANNSSSATYTGLTIRMATVSTSTFISTGAWYTGPMTTVLSQNTTLSPTAANSWVSIPLTTPFLYDPTMNLIIEVYHCGYTGTGFSMRQLSYGAAPNYRRQYSDATSACGAVPLPTGGDLNLPGIGITAAPASCAPNTTANGTATINLTGALVTISACNFAGDYSTINGAANGQTLSFTSSVATDFITIRSGTPGGPIIASGTTPLVFANTFTGTVYAHWNTPGCGTQNTCRTTTVQCTSCGAPPCTITLTSPPGSNNQTVCNGSPITNITYATTVATGATFSGLPPGVTGNWAGNVATISGTPTANGVYNYTVTLVGCTSATTATGTITVSTGGAPMIIVAVPGTTLCEGDPALLTVYNSAGSTPVTVSQSSSNTITAGTGVSCGTAGVSTAVNSYWRAYDLSTYPALTGSFTINSVNFGIEQLSGGTQLFTVRLYNQTGGAFPGGTRTQIASQTFNIPVQNLTIFTATFTTPPTVPNTSTIVVEVEKSAVVAGQFFWPGANTAAETAPSYISAAACAIVNPVTFASIGFPNTHLVINLAGTVAGVGGIVTGGTFLWSPAAGLSSTSTNPVAASPATTTTYTVSHNSGSGCIRTANITLTVNQRPVITSNPVNTTACAGSSVTFNATGTGTGATYQWQISTNGGVSYTNLANGAPYSGVTTQALTINPVTVAMTNNRYRLVVNGTCPPGTPPLNVSTGAILTVNALPVVTVTPTTGCGGVAGINGLLLTASGATSYTWAPLAGLYTNATATTAYTGGNTATVYAAPTSFTVYTVTGTSGTTGCSNTASATINYTPPAPTVTPSAVTMCLGDPAVRLVSASSTTSVANFTSGAISIAVPDNTPNGVSSNIPVAGIPGAATVSAVKVTWTMTHTWNGDMVFVLKAPNGNILNLDYYLSNTGGTGATTGFVNTAVGSTGTAALSSGTGTYTGLFKADGQMAPGLFGPPGPTGFAPTGNTWTQLYSVPNGTWTLAMYDGGLGDVGLLTSWSIEVTYVLGVPATPATWSPIAGLFNDALASIPYAGTPRDTVWARPTPSGVYPYTATVQSLGLPPTTVTTPMAGGNGNNLVAFNVRNNNAFPITFTGIGSNAFASGAVVSRVFYKTTPIAGAPGAIDPSNGWNQFGTANNTVTANTLNPLISGLTLSIPANTTYGIALDMTGATFPAYTNGTGTIVTYSGGGVDIITDGNVGWGGPAAPGVPVNNPRNFNGSISFSGGSTTACTSPARTVVVTVNQPTTITTQPVNQTVCTDKVASFSVVAAGTGPFTYQWQVSTDNGNTFTNITNGGVYSGATTNTLTITSPQVSMTNYQYRVIVNGAAPCASSTSFRVTLTVNALPVITIAASPYTSLMPGLVTTLSSTVSPVAAATYTWLRNGTPVVGGTNATLNVNVDGLGDYTLRVTNLNGCTSTSNTVSIRDSVSGRVFIYPNPNTGMFQVRYYSASNNVGLPRGIIIHDAKGDKVFAQNYTIGRPYDRMDVDMRKFGSGLYWLEVVDGNGNRLAIGRVVVQR